MLKTKRVVVVIAAITHFVGSLAALEPCYGKDGGNVTRVYTRQGEVHVIERRLKTVLKNLACHYGADLSALLKRYGDAFNTSYDTPIALDQDLVLVPLKTRKPLTDKDGATAYVAISSVKGVLPLDEDGFKCCLELEGGGRLCCMFAVSAVEDRLKLGQLANQYYRFLRTGYKEQPGAAVVRESKDGNTSEELLLIVSRLLEELLKK